jgi:hypothetical protein
MTADLHWNRRAEEPAMSESLNPRSASIAGVLLALSWSISYALDIPGADGSDGAFSPTSNVTIDLSTALTGSWSAPGSGNGVYDPNKWAVVFKYSSVDIPAGVTVTFKNHDSRAPVVWLVSGDVNIAGALNLDGQTYVAPPAVAEPGPGGFTGGIGYQNPTSPSGGGQGIAGGTQGASSGSHATAGASNSYPLYGNPRALPLVGGSGGGGDVNAARGGGAGGGALLLAVQGSLAVDGQIRAIGGQGINSGCCSYYQAGSGAGGAIRLVAETIAGTGGIYALGVGPYTSGNGRIRIEANTVAASWDVQPATSVVAPDDPVLLWLPTGAPTVEVAHIDTNPVPLDPHARLELDRQDVSLPLLGGESDILVQTTNVDPTATVQVRITPKYGAPALVNAVFDSGDTQQANWVATTTLPEGYFTVQAHAVNPAGP